MRQALLPCLLLAVVAAEHADLFSTALPPLPPYTYRATIAPTITDSSGVTGRVLKCQEEPQAFLQGFNFLVGGVSFEFTYGVDCQFQETGCWAPFVDHNTENYNESYKMEDDAHIQCTEGRSVNENQVKCLNGEWSYNESGEVLTSDACACTVTGYGVTQDSCGQCLEGSFSASTEEDENQCLLCPPGHYSATNGSTVCTQCLPGSYSNVHGAVRCEGCSGGYYAEEIAAVECEECPRGSFTIGDGSVNCLVCPVGHTTYINNPDSEPCVGPKLGMRNNKDKVTDRFLTQISDLGNFRDNVRVHFNNKGQWNLYNKLQYVHGMFHFMARARPWFTTATIESIKPTLRGVYCYVSGEQFRNTQFVHTVSGAECESYQGSKAYCTNEGQLVKEPGCYIDTGNTHAWQVCDIPKCKETEQCPHMDHDAQYGRVINVKKGLCWDGRGYPAINDGNNIGYNKCNEPVDRPTTDHNYRYFAKSGQIRSYRAKEERDEDLCLTLIPNTGDVVLKTCGTGEQGWNIMKDGCLFKLVARDSDQCIGCYQGNSASCDLHTLTNCDSDYVWHKFLPIDDLSCTYTKIEQKPADSVYKSLRFDSKVAAKATCNQLGYKCSGYLFNNNNDNPSYSLLSGEMVDLEGSEEYWSKSKDCDETTRTAAFEQTYNSKKTEKEVNINTSSSHINDP